MDYSPRGSSVRGILQARILEWVAIWYYYQGANMFNYENDGKTSVELLHVKMSYTLHTSPGVYTFTRVNSPLKRILMDGLD